MAQKQSVKPRRSAAFKQLRANFDQSTQRVDQLLEGVSIIDAGYLFRNYWDDYTSGVRDLLDVLEELDAAQIAELARAEDANGVHPDLKPTLRRLCELSREVTFSIDPLRLPVDIRSEIEKLFRFSVDQVPEIADEAASSHVSNIGRRLFTPIAVV
jgi:hypothetical protein